MIAGGLDLLYAFVYFGLRGISPERILVPMFSVGAPIAIGAREASRWASPRPLV